MKENDNNLILSKSKAFAIRCIKLRHFLVEEKKEYDISKQVLRSGTSIGANAKEGVRGQTKADFTAKMCVALKEASETEYWLELLRDTDYLTADQANSLLDDCVELIKILVSITKTSMENK